MTVRTSRSILTALAVCVVPLLPALCRAQESSFQPRFETNDRDARFGHCRLRIQIDDQTDVIMFGDRVILRTITGQPPSYDVGSECSSPLPRHGVIDFDFRKTEGPGSATLRESPDRDEARVVIHVYDPQAGAHRYTLEFRWRSEHRDRWDSWGDDAPPPGPRILGAWNWVDGQTLVIHDDRTCEVYGDEGRRKVNDCRWERLGDRDFRITYNYGGAVDTVTLSDDGNSLDGQRRVHGSRTEFRR
jgi:hypothetical protein